MEYDILVAKAADESNENGAVILMTRSREMEDGGQEWWARNWVDRRHTVSCMVVWVPQCKQNDNLGRDRRACAAL